MRCYTHELTLGQCIFARTLYYFILSGYYTLIAAILLKIQPFTDELIFPGWAAAIVLTYALNKYIHAEIVPDFENELDTDGIVPLDDEKDMFITLFQYLVVEYVITFFTVWVVWDLVF